MLVFICFPVGDSAIPLTGLMPPHIWVCLKPGPGFPTSDFVDVFVSSEMVRGDCSFCWYWRNCWPWLFAFSFHNKHFDISAVFLQIKLQLVQYDCGLWQKWFWFPANKYLCSGFIFVRATPLFLDGNTPTTLPVCLLPYVDPQIAT